MIEIQRETVSAVTSLASSFVNNTMTRRPAMRLLSAAMLLTAKGFTVPISISLRAGRLAFHSDAGKPGSITSFQPLPGESGFTGETKRMFWRGAVGFDLSSASSSSSLVSEVTGGAFSAQTASE